MDINLDLDTTLDYSPDNKLDLISLIQRTIKESLEQIMPGLIQEAIKGVMAVITDQLAIHKQEIARIEQDVASTNERLNTVVTSVDHLENKVDEIEQEMRASSVIFLNEWPESPTESAQSLVRKYTNEALYIDLNDNDIIKCFRLGRRSNRSSKPRPILVSFASTSTKTEVLLARRRIRNFVSEGFPRPVFINEDLTLRRQTLFTRCRKLKKEKLINDCWSLNGKIFIKSLSDEVKSVNPQVLATLFPDQM